VWAHATVATNWATASENRIHDDDVARRLGFGGGLVPGVTLYAYLTDPIVERWGRDWLEGGWADVRFVSPVYDGDRVTAVLDDEGLLELRGSNGAVCASGSAGTGTDGGPAWRGELRAATDLPAAPLPGVRPPAGDGSLAPGTVLGTVEHRFDTERGQQYLAMVGCELELYRRERIAHPGLLLADANTVLVANVVLGPWIHVSSRIEHLAVVTDGQVLSTRARVASCCERKGHRFVELDVVTLADGRPALAVHHTAIWQVRPRPD